MKSRISPSHRSPFKALHALVLVLGLTCQLHALAGPFDDRIAQARAHLEAGRGKEGLAAARQAIAIQPNDYRGHYYASLAALSLGQLPEAEAALEKSRASAPAGAQDALRKVADAIGARKGADKSAAPAFVYLSCSGESEAESISSGNVRKEAFRETYRVNLAGNSMATWKDGWSELACSKDFTKPPGYIAWSRSASCSVYETNFRHIDEWADTADDGKKTSRKIFLEISRVTGALSIDNYFEYAYANGKSGGVITKTKASCEPTAEPKKAPPPATKF